MAEQVSKQVLSMLRGMSADSARLFLDNLAAESKRQAAEQKQAAQDRERELASLPFGEIETEMQAALSKRDMKRYSELTREHGLRLKEYGQAQGRERFAELVAGQVRSGQPLNFDHLQAHAARLGFSGDIRQVANETSERVFAEKNTPPAPQLSPEQVQAQKALAYIKSLGLDPDQLGGE